jgi:hypothetical protein
MLDELIVEEDGRRYIGHVWAAPGGLGRTAPLRWRFARRGKLTAEFPATPFDTPEAVRTRFLAALRRIEELEPPLSARTSIEYCDRTT